MKIAIITMHAVKNYGSVLQTYATQKVLNDMGVETEVINYIRKKNLDSNLLNTWTYNDHGIKKYIKKSLLYPTVRRWKKVFRGYLKENVNLSENTYTSEEDLLKKPIAADIFCTGSDQVWNSGWNNGIEKAFYLSFVPDSVPKISIAASVGKTELDDEEIKAIFPLLQRYNFITMREATAVNMLKLCGIRNCDFCLDPTLLMTKEEWLDHATSVSFKKKYVLVYQLNHDAKFDSFAKEYARAKKLELVRICTRYDQVRLPGRPIIIPEVQELLGWFLNAEIIITNSFHATAFSINLNKEFISIFPDEYSSRISDLLTLFGLNDRHVSSYSLNDLPKSKIDFSGVNEKLCQERTRSLKLIRKMIGEIEQ